MSGYAEDSVVLVPLNTSLYIPGKLCDPKSLIVELGTGYFAEKTDAEANDLIERKVRTRVFDCM